MNLSRETERLSVRLFEESDFKAWAYALSSLAPRKANPWDIGKVEVEYLTQERYDLLLRSQESDRDEDSMYEFGVFLKPSKALIGVVSIMDITRGIFQNAYIGYRIYHHHWGRGYGLEACRALIELAFQELKLHRVEAGISPTNERSIRLAKALKLRYEGCSPKRLYLDGRWQDMDLYAATCEDFGLEWKPLA